MEITKKIPRTIVIDDNNPELCDRLCNDFIDGDCFHYCKCNYYNCELEEDRFRCKQCITDFGV